MIVLAGSAGRQHCYAMLTVQAVLADSAGSAGRQCWQTALLCNAGSAGRQCWQTALLCNADSAGSAGRQCWQTALLCNAGSAGSAVMGELPGELNTPQHLPADNWLTIPL